MSRFFEDWDEVKKYLEETPMTKEREELFQKAMKSMGVIKENLKEIQKELYFWPKFKARMAKLWSISSVQYIVLILAGLCLIGIDIFLMSFIDFRNNNDLSPFYIGGIFAFFTFCYFVLKVKCIEEEILGIIPIVIGTIIFWPAILAIAGSGLIVYYFAKLLRNFKANAV